MTAQDAPRRGDGPRRSETARQAVLNAADDLLVERGFAAVTVEGIAARAGVAKQTIYRWWKSKVDILLDNLIEDADTALAWPVLDSAQNQDPVDDLVRQVSRIVAFLDREPAGQVMRSLVGHAQHDPDAARRLRDSFLLPQRERDLAGLRAVLIRLACPPASDDGLASLLDQLLGPVYYRLLVFDDPPDAAFVHGLVNDVVATASRERAR